MIVKYSDKYDCTCQLNIQIISHAMYFEIAGRTEV